jgi:L-ribulokinase
MTADDHKYAIGLDYGTSSVRALVVNCANGEEIGSSVWPYRHGNEGVVEDPSDDNVGRQHPQDYIDGLYASVAGALKDASRAPHFDPSKVVGIGVDTTGSSPMPIDANCTPLACRPQFDTNPNAMCWLWKDHTSYAEAQEIIDKSNGLGFPYMQMVGGKYSSEWFWAKILHCARVDSEVFAAAHSWVELADYVPAYLTGVKDSKDVVRGVCAAGHKGLYNPDWGGLPDKRFLGALDPRLADLRDRLYDTAVPSDQVAGTLDPAVASRLGLSASTIVAVGAFDAHMGAVGSGVKTGVLVKIMGTSTCDIMVAPMPEDGKLPLIPGMCGVVKGSVLPGMLGIEAGQSAVGDLFNWFVRYLCPASFDKADAHGALSAEALKLRPGESGLLALDWNNGNRTVLVDQRLTGVLLGQTLQTSAPEIYRALIEATAFGALTIIKRMEEYGATVDEVVNCGGIAEKSALTMQIYADVCNRPMKVSRSAQTCALGAALFASVAAGVHENVLDAQAAMTGVKELVYHPDPKAVNVYGRLYAMYMKLHDSFGGRERSMDLGGVMKELLSIKDQAKE